MFLVVPCSGRQPRKTFVVNKKNNNLHIAPSFVYVTSFDMEFFYPVGLCVQRNVRPIARVYGITPEHKLVIVMGPDRVFNGMSEFVDHMMQQRPRTRNARETFQRYRV